LITTYKTSKKEQIMQITIIQKQVYGNTVFYPACDISKKFSDIAQTKTLREADLKIIKSMGYQIIVTAEKKEF
jgi:hypothetical protein